jgi:head-tail adaptor
MDNNELADMRAAVLDLLPDTCNILSVTETPDGAGGMTQTWGTASAGVACRLDYQTGMETIAGGALRAYSRYILTVPYDASVTELNKIEHGTKTYNVSSVDDDKSWPIVRRVVLE